MSQKVAPPPPELFVVFSLLVNLCNWKLPWLLPKHISMPTLILIHLSEFLKMYHFTSVTPQILRIQLVCYKIHEFFVKARHIKWYLIKYNNWYLLYELSHYMFKISTVGWQTHVQSMIAVVFHRVVKGFLQQGRPNQLKCICKLGNCFWLRLQLVIRLQHFPQAW